MERLLCGARCWKAHGYGAGDRTRIRLGRAVVLDGLPSAVDFILRDEPPEGWASTSRGDRLPLAGTLETLRSSLKCLSGAQARSGDDQTTCASGGKVASSATILLDLANRIPPAP